MDSSAQVPRAIVAGHGMFPDGVVSAVEQITGRGSLLVSFSNAGLGREEIESGMRRLLAQHGVSVIFTDLLGGSATLAARRIMRDVPSLTVVTGANLSTLIDFVFCDGSMTSGEAARHAAEKGRASLTATGG
ncbi:MAG: PTS sugar transporter subunit IIA [Gemmatimonadaceae bacterium]